MRLYYLLGGFQLPLELFNVSLVGIHRILVLLDLYDQRRYPALNVSERLLGQEELHLTIGDLSNKLLFAERIFLHYDLCVFSKFLPQALNLELQCGSVLALLLVRPLYSFVCVPADGNYSGGQLSDLSIVLLLCRLRLLFVVGG